MWEYIGVIQPYVRGGRGLWSLRTSNWLEKWPLLIFGPDTNNNHIWLVCNPQLIIHWIKSDLENDSVCKWSELWLNTIQVRRLFRSWQGDTWSSLVDLLDGWKHKIVKVAIYVEIAGNLRWLHKGNIHRAGEDSGAEGPELNLVYIASGGIGWRIEFDL